MSLSPRTLMKENDLFSGIDDLTSEMTTADLPTKLACWLLNWDWLRKLVLLGENGVVSSLAPSACQLLFAIHDRFETSVFLSDRKNHRRSAFNSICFSSMRKFVRKITLFYVCVSRTHSYSVADRVRCHSEHCGCLVVVTLLLLFFFFSYSRVCLSV